MTPTARVNVLPRTAGGRYPMTLIKDMLDHGTQLEIRTDDGWHRVTRIAARIEGHHAIVGIQYLMSPDDLTSYRVDVNESLWVRIPPEPRKAVDSP